MHLSRFLHNSILLMGKEKLTKALIDIHYVLIAPPHSHADEFLQIFYINPISAGNLFQIAT